MEEGIVSLPRSIAFGANRSIGVFSFLGDPFIPFPVLLPAPRLIDPQPGGECPAVPGQGKGVKSYLMVNKMFFSQLASKLASSASVARFFMSRIK